jgi:PAS domain-containing protein
LEIDRDNLSPHRHHTLKNFVNDHLGVHLPHHAQTAPSTMGDHQSLDPEVSNPPLTPKIQVMAPPDELSEDEIQYIGVGLGTLSTEDKKHRHKSPTRTVSEPNPSLNRRESSETMRSDLSGVSGTSTPSEPMVYASPLITHENVFEHAFQRAEDKIRLTDGDNTMIYSTWRSEEINGEPVSNQYGRNKVELERIDGDETQPRWERILKEKFPEKLEEIHSRKPGDWRPHLRDKAEKMLGGRATIQLDAVRQLSHDSTKSTEGDPHKEAEPSNVEHGLKKEDTLREKAHKHLDTVKGVVESLKGGFSKHEIPQNQGKDSHNAS